MSNTENSKEDATAKPVEEAPCRLWDGNPVAYDFAGITRSMYIYIYIYIYYIYIYIYIESAAGLLFRKKTTSSEEFQQQRDCDRAVVA